MWLSICRTVMPSCLLSGMNVSIVSSRLSLPSSRNAMIATAVNVLLCEAIRYCVSAVGATPGTVQVGGSHPVGPGQRTGTGDGAHEPRHPALGLTFGEHPAERGLGLSGDLGHQPTLRHPVEHRM